PEFAAALANEWARLALELSGAVSAKGKSGSAEFLQGRLEQVNEQLETVEASIQEHETQWDMEAMTLRGQEMQKAITEYELDQVRLNTEIESARAELEAVAKDLESTSEKTTLRKAPSDEAYWLMEATGKGNPDSKDVLESEVVSEVFVILREHKTTL